MENLNYNHPDYRSTFEQLIEVFSPKMNAQEESILRSLSAESYCSDFYSLLNILNGKTVSSKIQSKAIDNATEYYKQLNKSFLKFRYLSPVENACESKAIDSEAKILKDDWCHKLQEKGILII